jgi:hypothetical protein
MHQQPILTPYLAHVSDARLIHTACDEIMSAFCFRKVLGIVLHLGNLLNTTGSSSKDMAGALKVESLLKLHQAKAFDKKTTFLQYAASVIRRNSPTLLQIKDDLRTLTLAKKVNWEQSLDELENMEASLSEIRQLALASGAEDSQSRVGISEGEASLIAEEEVRCLQSTYIGSFTVDASLRMASAYGDIESSKRAFLAFLNYFGEEERFDIGPQKFLGTLSLFCGNFNAAVERAIAVEKEKVRETRLTCGPRYQTRIQRLETSRKAGPSSAMGNVLADIRK